MFLARAVRQEQLTNHFFEQLKRPDANTSAHLMPAKLDQFITSYLQQQHACL